MRTATSLTTAAPTAATRDAPHRPLVDVIGIGVQKSATTWLYRCLAEHPAIGIARAGDGQRSHKELNFFNHEYERGYVWYERPFSPGPPRQMEYSTLYFHDRNAPVRIRRYNPDARLLLSLRNPIDRAFSHHKHEVRRGRLPAELHAFRRALAQNPSYLEQGLYATHLERWLEEFPLEQIHIVLYDDLSARPAGTLERVFAFLDVDPTFRPGSTPARVNESVAVRSPRIARVLRSSSGLVRRSLGRSVHGSLKATGLPARLRTWNRTGIERVVVDPLGAADRAALGERFRIEIERLGEIIGRDLSHWR